MKTAVFSDVTPSTWVNCRTLCTKRQQSSHHSAFTKFLSRTIYPNLQKIQYTLGVTLNPRCIWFSCQQLLCSQLHKNRLLGAKNHWQLNRRNLCQIQHHMKRSAKRGLTKINHINAVSNCLFLSFNSWLVLFYGKSSWNEIKINSTLHKRFRIWTA